MAINVMPRWCYEAMDKEFNRRQMMGEPCADLVRLMIRELFPERRASDFYMGGRYPRDVITR